MKVLRGKLLLLLPYITFFVVGIFLLFEPILDGDEIWNYNFARNNITHMVVAIVPFVPCIFLHCKIKRWKSYETYLCQAVAWTVLLVSALSVFEAEE